MKLKVDFIAGVLIEIVGIICLLFPLFSITNAKFALQFVMICYVVINFLRYFFVRKTKDLEGLFTGIVSLILFIILFFIPLSNKLALSLSVFAFVFLMSFVRLKKSDYYNDRKDKKWILELTCLIIFIISGLLTSFSILITNDGNILIMGYLFFINGFIEIIDPVVNYIEK
jgi:uncharacterized membrane protein HdeD (DUF308 family)